MIQRLSRVISWISSYSYTRARAYDLEICDSPGKCVISGIVVR